MGDHITKDEWIKLGELVGENSQHYAKSKLAILTKSRAHFLAVDICYVNGVKNIVEFDNKNLALEWLFGK